MQFKNLVDAVENKYNQLLTILVVMYLVSPFVIDSKIPNLIIFLVFLGSINLVIYQIQHSKRLLRWNLGLNIVALVFRSFNDLGFSSGDFNIFCSTFSTLIFLFSLSFSLYLILREMFIIYSSVTADTIKGGICAYFLLGFFWAYLYNIVYLSDANSFSSAVTKINMNSCLLYFSFTTLTTTGYGDILPVTPIARVLSNFEGIVGILYPTVSIARLVGLYKS
jgi:hypothetical protein